MLVIDWFKKCCKRIFPSVPNRLEGEIKDSAEVLDLGCGKDSPMKYCKTKPYSIGVELFKPYLQEDNNIHSGYVLADVNEVEFKENSFDTVLALDLLEHLKKEDGYRLIKKMENWARRKIIILTPNGFVRQDKYDDNPLQVHRAGWNPDELKSLGFKVYGRGWILKIRRSFKIEFKPQLFWHLLLTRKKFRTLHSEDAFHLFCVKNLTQGGEYV